MQNPGLSYVPLRRVRINFTFLSPRLASRFPSLLRCAVVCGDIMASFFGRRSESGQAWAAGRGTQKTRGAFGSSSAARERGGDEDGKRGGDVPIPRSPIKADAGNESETVLRSLREVIAAREVCTLCLTIFQLQSHVGNLLC